MLAGTVTCNNNNIYILQTQNKLLCLQHRLYVYIQHSPQTMTLDCITSEDTW